MKDGLQRMLDFLEFLSDKNIHYFIEQPAPDHLMATFTLVGARVEVSFFVDHLEYCVFKGSEAVNSDENRLQNLVEEYERE